MIKLSIFLFSLLISISLISQNLQSINPNNGNHGQTLNLSLSCQNANFSSGTNTQVWFSQGSYTMMGTNTTIVNNNLINTDLYISPAAPSGVYNSLASNSIDGTLMKASSFTVNNYTPLTATTYPNFSKAGKNIDVFVNIPSNYLSSQLYYQKDNEVIPITIQNNMYPGTGMYGNANIPASASLGGYNLVIIDSNNTQIITNALTLVASTEPSIDSAVVEKLYYRVLDVYGDQTHFTSYNLIVTVDEFFSFPIDSFVVINDQHLKIYGGFMLHVDKNPFPWHSWLEIYNSTDDTLTYPFKKWLTISIGDNLNSFDNIRYFPNPTTDIVRIQCDEFIGNTILVEVYSPDGKFVLERKFTNGEPVVIDLGAYASGLYNIRVSTRDKTKTLSVIRR